MPFTIYEYHDLVHLLEEHADWRAELRRLLLPSELMGDVYALTAAQRQFDERLVSLAEDIKDLAVAQDRNDQQIQELILAQRRTDELLVSLAEEVKALVIAQRRTDERLESFEKVQQRLVTDVAVLKTDVAVLKTDVAVLKTDVGHLKGQSLEMTYRYHAAGYFGRWIRRARVVPLGDIEEKLESTLSYEELLEVLRLDLLINGRRRDQAEKSELWLAIEVSAVLNEGDVNRAVRRATLLRQAGYVTVPVVAGEEITVMGEESARTQKVVVVQDGRHFGWDEAVATWLSE